MLQYELGMHSLIVLICNKHMNKQSTLLLNGKHINTYSWLLV